MYNFFSPKISKPILLKKKRIIRLKRGKDLFDGLSLIVKTLAGRPPSLPIRGFWNERTSLWVRRITHQPTLSLSLSLLYSGIPEIQKNSQTRSKSQNPLLMLLVCKITPFSLFSIPIFGSFLWVGRRWSFQIMPFGIGP